MRSPRDYVDVGHHFASWFVMRGGSLQALKEILGRADLKMTLRYAHLAPEHLRNEMVKTGHQATKRVVEGARLTARESVTSG
jgi:site-specific recombinase XerC